MVALDVQSASGTFGYQGLGAVFDDLVRQWLALPAA